MKTYRVRWEIDIEADSPEEAACRALIIQRDNDPENSATVFDVRWDIMGFGGRVAETETRRIDLDRIDASAAWLKIKSEARPANENEKG